MFRLWVDILYVSFMGCYIVCFVCGLLYCMFRLWVVILYVSFVDCYILCFVYGLLYCMFRLWIVILYVSFVGCYIVCFVCGLLSCMFRLWVDILHVSFMGCYLVCFVCGLIYGMFRLWVVILYVSFVGCYLVSVISVIFLTAIEARFPLSPRKCWDEHSGPLECDAVSSRQQYRTFRRILSLANAGMFLQTRYDGSLLIIPIFCHPELCANNSTELCHF